MIYNVLSGYYNYMSVSYHSHITPVTGCSVNEMIAKLLQLRIYTLCVSMEPGGHSVAICHPLLIVAIVYISRWASLMRLYS